MTKLSPNAQLVSSIFEKVARGNGAPFWEACHDDIVWRRDGKILRYEEYCDTDLIARVLPDRVAAKSMSRPA